MGSILIFVDDLYEDLELWFPKIRMEEAGFKTIIAGPTEKGSHLGKHGYPCKVDLSYEMVKPMEMDALIIPGGYAPDRIRRSSKALSIVKEMHEKKKPIAFICHAGWVPISANILRGRNVTGFIAIKDDLVNAGAKYSDEPVVVDENLISSRTPKDLPQFCSAILKCLGK